MYRYKLETQCVIVWQVQWDTVTSGEPLHTGPAVLPLHLGSKYTARGRKKTKKTKRLQHKFSLCSCKTVSMDPAIQQAPLALLMLMGNDILHLCVCVFAER